MRVLLSLQLAFFLTLSIDGEGCIPDGHRLNRNRRKIFSLRTANSSPRKSARRHLTGSFPTARSASVFPHIPLLIRKESLRLRSWQCRRPCISFRHALIQPISSWMEGIISGLIFRTHPSYAATSTRPASLLHQSSQRLRGIASWSVRIAYFRVTGFPLTRDMAPWNTSAVYAPSDRAPFTVERSADASTTQKLPYHPHKAAGGTKAILRRRTEEV